MFPDLTRDDVFRIETRRLWLRWPHARDAAAVMRLAGDRAVAEATARIPHPIDPPGIGAFLADARRGNGEGRSLILAAALRPAPTALVGIVAIEPDATAEGPHLGYWLGRPYWGQGLMSEAARALVAAYFAYAGGSVLTSAAVVGNAASRRVLAKCGFDERGEGLRAFPARGGERRTVLFRLTRADWAARCA